ncbi:MAG: WG repeat-containing protein [Cyclobacteriaceae bacterium]
MKRITAIVFFQVLFQVSALAQFTAEHAAMNNLKKGKWEKARAQLSKAMRKDSVNAEARYILAVYFFTPSNPAFQIDSAYQHTMQALSDFQVTSLRHRDRLKKIPLDSMVLIMFRQQIDSAAFERAKRWNTEEGYIDFLKRFPFAIQQEQAAELRDEVAYVNAMKANTYVAFLKYLEKYPESARAPEAKARYDKLLFESKTKDKKLLSYESFLKEYPKTPYRLDVEKQIFEISTASGEASVFEKFLQNYPESSKSKLAQHILYYLLKDDDRLIPPFILNDSIRKQQELEKHYLVPFLKNDRYGFMNEHGEEIIEPAFTEMPDDYLCGNVMDQVLVFQDRILARNGAILFKGVVDDTERLGYGFMEVRSDRCVMIIHVSGFSIGIGDNCYQDAKMLGKNYLALKRENRWSVWTLTGRMLIDFVWDDVERMGDVVVFRKSNKYKLVRMSDVFGVANQVAIPYAQEFDDVKAWANGMFWVKAGNEQGVLNQNLKAWIKPGNQEITPSFFGSISRTAVGYKLHERSSSPSQNFIRVKVNQPWVAVQHAGMWQLIDPVTKQFTSPSFDSISFNGPFFIGIRNDSLRIYMTRDNFIELKKSRLQFLPGRDSLYFLLVEEVGKKTLYDSKGRQVFVADYDKVEYNNESYFTVLKKDKRGIINLHGKLIVPTEYDALGTVKQGVVQTLRDKKFGLLDIVHRKEIKAEYDKNIVSYNPKVNIACKGGLCGLVGWDNKFITPLEFEEIRYWNDSSALVKKSFNWIIYNFVEKKMVMDKIKTFKKVQDTEGEKVLIVQQENKYGVISNRKGIIIPPTFTDIVNLGSSTAPLYFTEKHVEEASIFVVIYYDKSGVLLRRQVFETDDYEKIYCSGN